MCSVINLQENKILKPLKLYGKFESVYILGINFQNVSKLT